MKLTKRINWFSMESVIFNSKKKNENQLGARKRKPSRKQTMRRKVGVQVLGRTIEENLSQKVLLWQDMKA